MRELILRRRRRRWALHCPTTRADKLVLYHEMLVETNRVINLTRVPDDPARGHRPRTIWIPSLPLAAPQLMDGVKTLVRRGHRRGLSGRTALHTDAARRHVVLLDALGKRVKFLQAVVGPRSISTPRPFASALRGRGSAVPRCRDRFDLRRRPRRGRTADAVRADAALREGRRALHRLQGAFAGRGARAVGRDPEAHEGRMPSDASPSPSPAATGITGCAPVVRKNAPTPASFPRKAGEAGRNPILR